MECAAERAPTDRLRVLSNFSPVLAAKAAKLPECYHLKSFGDGLVSRCVIVKADFSPRWTKCGFQPYFKANPDRTLESDGSIR